MVGNPCTYEVNILGNVAAGTAFCNETCFRRATGTCKSPTRPLGSKMERFTPGDVRGLAKIVSKTTRKEVIVQAECNAANP